MPIEMKAMVPMLKARSLEETVSFYTRVLGFRVVEHLENWCYLEWGGAAVMFYDSELPPGPPTLTGALYFNPSDVDALWEHLKTRAPVAWELQVMDYGMREFAIFDPNGYTLSFGQEVATPGAPPAGEPAT